MDKILLTALLIRADALKTAFSVLLQTLKLR